VALARLISRGQSGLEAYEVRVEVHLAGGLPSFSITGLPTASVRESKDRVRAALHTSGIAVPSRRITVHLGPAEIPKEGGRFDLPIALALIQADQKLPWATGAIEFLGELSLSGELRGIPGVLPSVLAAHRVGHSIVVPEANASEAAIVDTARVYPARHLKDVLAHLNGTKLLSSVKPQRAPQLGVSAQDLADVRGQPAAKRALSIAAAGQHNMLMVGPPGSGKSMLAERLRGLLPALTHAEYLCSESLKSLTASISQPVGTNEPPFRAPHHTISAQALVGGGVRPKPGEVSHAHRGVLFLDEFPEFSRSAIEALREPLETGEVRISRVLEQARYPAQFQLIAAMNPCLCGYFGDGTDRCMCTPAGIGRYRNRISGPMLDRFDLHVEVPRISIRELRPAPRVLESPTLRERVMKLRALQIQRQGELNSNLSGDRLWEALQLEDAARELFEQAAERWELSARGTVRTLRTARTIADLDDCAAVGRDHIAEAVQLRCLDRPMFRNR